MKKLLLTSFLLLFFALCGFPQTHIAVQNNGEASFYRNFADALAAAAAGDTIYLPGGNFNIGTINIDKKLTILGVGHYPEYTQATGITSLHGNIILLQGADHTQLMGFYLTGNIQLGTTSSNQEVNNLSIKRCSLNELRLNYNAGANETTSQNIMVMENVIRGNVYGGNSQYVYFSKNLIGSRVLFFNGNTTFTNNIFLKQSTSWNDYVFRYIESVNFYNNVFLNSSYYLLGSNTFANTFNNNIFVQGFTVPTGSTGVNNIVSKPLDEIFVNYTGGSFDYESDFHLTETSEGIGAGADGNDIGIYGTSIPYKEGAVPFNPHIVSQQVSPETDEDGNIQININVEAQQR